MAAPNHLTEAEKAAHISGAPVDPFAVDFFGGAKPLAEEEDETTAATVRRTARRTSAEKKSDWHKNLPRLTYREAEFSNLLSNLPENLTETAAAYLGETLARYSLESPERVSCEVISVREVNLNQAIRNSGESLKVFLTVGARTDDSLAIAALDADFAEALIAALLNDARRAGGARRELSPIETTIVEFLAAHVLSDINAFLGDSVLYLRGVSGQARDFYESAERGAEITFGVNLGDLRGKVGLFASPGFLRYLDRSRNPLFEKRNQRKKLSDFEKIARVVDLRLQLGTTFLDADSLLYLEPDDIVLIEQPQIGLHGDSFAGNMQIRVGTGANFRLRGAAEASELTDGLNFRIEEITSEETRRRSMPAKFKMDEKENDLTPENEFESGSGEDAAGAADEEATPALENVQVALRVEIAGSKISLRELQNMRVGQIIALGTSPHDPVRLVTDTSEDAIAAGELIEIEGQLGVRLTKVFI